MEYEKDTASSGVKRPESGSFGGFQRNGVFFAPRSSQGLIVQVGQPAIDDPGGRNHNPLVNQVGKTLCRYG